jgi:poly-gamma-glutamate synthesis protein (capsule biosynthesis protein)
MIDIAFVGDVMLGRGVDRELRRMHPAQPWSDVLPLLTGADVRIANLECALTRHATPWLRTPKVFHFRADPSAVEVLRAARIDACSLANNHTLDFGEQGLIDTLDTLDRAGIAHAGAGRNAADAAKPAFVSAGGSPVSIALIAFTDNEPAFAAMRDRAGTQYLPVSLTPESLGRVAHAIGAARAAGATIVVFSNHWGPNMRLRPTPLFRAFAHAVIDLGVDIYYGHSAHVFQGIEIHAGKPILYDTGDFIDDYAVDRELRNDWSLVFRIRMEGGLLHRIDLFPVTLAYARVARAHGSERDEILDRMESLSAEMGTRFARENGHAVHVHRPQAASR